MKYALVVAGTHSNVGKTTVSIALMAALRRRGFAVQAFKVGPDFIDPSFHVMATGRPCYNLDGWMLSRKTNLRVFARAAASADVIIIEGVMGLFDGASALDESGSTSEMAKWLGLPVVLVMDAAAQARSAAAVVHGFETFDPELRVPAVIANRVAGEGHYRYIRDAIQASCRAEPLGWLACNPAISLPSRHLGLITAPEIMDAARLKSLADWIDAGIDLDRLLTLFRQNVSRGEAQLNGKDQIEIINRPETNAPIRIGVAYDRAFCFYYKDNLALLEQLGAELVFWSPIEAPLPSGLQGLYFGGGYPELYAAELSANETAREAVKAFIHSGGGVYAECGGLMYLTEAIVGLDDAEYPMVGIFPTRARMRRHLVALGYSEVEGLAGANGGFLDSGETARGHEFRYSEIDSMPEDITRYYQLRSQKLNGESRHEGYSVYNCLASYIHLHFLSNPHFTVRWLDRCCRTKITT